MLDIIICGRLIYRRAKSGGGIYKGALSLRALLILFFLVVYIVIWRGGGRGAYMMARFYRGGGAHFKIHHKKILTCFVMYDKMDS